MAIFVRSFIIQRYTGIHNHLILQQPNESRKVYSDVKNSGTFQKESRLKRLLLSTNMGTTNHIFSLSIFLPINWLIIWMMESQKLVENVHHKRPTVETQKVFSLLS